MTFDPSLAFLSLRSAGHCTDALIYQLFNSKSKLERERASWAMKVHIPNAIIKLISYVEVE
jgi:hypothetical protein